VENDLRPISEFIERLPGARGAKRLSPSTVTRWISSGVKAASGNVVRLRAVRVGWRWLTREEWVDQFISDLSCVPGAPSVRSPTEVKRASERAGRELEAAGA
jgi:hypothetical protein